MVSPDMFLVGPNRVHHRVGVLRSRAVNKLLGKKNICFILPARREFDTFPARRDRSDKNFTQKEPFCLTKNRVEEKKRSP